MDETWPRRDRDWRTQQNPAVAQTECASLVDLPPMPPGVTHVHRHPPSQLSPCSYGSLRPFSPNPVFLSKTPSLSLSLSLYIYTCICTYTVESHHPCQLCRSLKSESFPKMVLKLPKWPCLFSVKTLRR